MIDTIINSNIKSSEIVIIGANYDKTSSFGKGADKAPGVIIEILNHQIELYDRFTKRTPSQKIKIAYKDLGNLNKLSPEAMIKRVSAECYEPLSAGKFLITVGGEHSVTNGPVLAISQLKNIKPSDITIVQLDAHFDLREDDSDYNDKPFGRYAHSAVMRRCAELGFNLVQVGIRAYSEDEYNYAQNNKRIKYFEWGASKNKPELFMEPSLNEIVNSINTKYVYISIDVDGFDPSVMPETGTPVPGGISWDYGTKLVSKIFREKNVIAADIVEVAPKDDDSYTAYNAAQIIHNMISEKYAQKIVKK